MSVYNEPMGWLRQSIDSILAQTYQNFEFIIVNDSPMREENAQLLKEYEQKDSRVVVVTNETNIGLTKSLNKALGIARGKFIARMDADDVSSPNRLERQVTYLISHPNVCAVGSWIVQIDEQGEVISEPKKYGSNPNLVKAQFLQNSQLCHPTAMFRKRVNNYTALYDETLRYAQDYALWVSMLPYGRISNIPEVLFQYRTSGIQITNNKKVEQQHCAAIVQKRVFDLFNLPATESFLSIFSTITIQHNVDMPFQMVKKEFCNFFKNVRITESNTLALEIIYNTYLIFIQGNVGGSKTKYVRRVIGNSSPFMLMLGCKFYFYLMQRKIHLKK